MARPSNLSMPLGGVMERTSHFIEAMIRFYVWKEEIRLSLHGKENGEFDEAYDHHVFELGPTFQAPEAIFKK
jgi:hypothetical protein